MYMLFPRAFGLLKPTYLLYTANYALKLQ